MRNGPLILSQLVRRHTEPVVLAGTMVVILALVSALGPNPVPLGMYLVGAVGGAAVALHAVGLVLVHRANRIINFAQLQMGVLAGTLFAALVAHRPFLRGLHAVCPPCVPVPRTVGDLAGSRGVVARDLLSVPSIAANPQTPLTDPVIVERLPADHSSADFAVEAAAGWLVQANYWLSFVVALTVGTLLVFAVYLLVIKRFNSAPRLLLTVITLGAGTFAVTVGNFAVEQLFGGGPESRVVSDGAPNIPIGARFLVSGTQFSASDLALVLASIGAMVGLVIFFRRSRTGLVLQGASQNPQRAQSLGVNVAAVTARAWIIAGALSSLAAILMTAKMGPATVAGYGTVVFALAAAVIGGMASLPLAVVGALALGVANQAVLWATGAEALTAGVVLAIVLTLLLAQRARASRADVEAQTGWLASRELRPIPAEMRDLPVVRTTRRVLAALGAVVLVGYPWFMSPGQINLAVVTMVYIAVHLSLLVLVGWAGQISLASMAFAAIGAWTAAVLGWPFLLSLLAAGLAGAVIAVLIGLPALRLRGQHLAIVTLALALAVASIVVGPNYLGQMLPTSVGRPMFLGIDFDDGRAFYYFTLVVVAIAVVATVGLRRSPTGRALIASKDNEQAAASFGVTLVRARLTAFAISGFMAAVAGAIFGYSQRIVEAAPFQPEASVDRFLFTIIGGLGAVAGPVLGGLAYLLIEILQRVPGIGGTIELIASPQLLVILVLLFVPGGLAQVLYGARDAWLRRLASRYRIAVPTLNGDQGGAAGERMPILPNEGPDGGPAYVPHRYELPHQWRAEPQGGREVRRRAEQAVTAGE